MRLWREGGASDESRIDLAARPAEQAAVRRLLTEARGRLQRGELRATEVAFSPRLKAAELPADATPAELAAWTLVARVMLNLDETLTKP
ncbi:MAG: hypothetical protein ACO3G4_06500 [Opitutaceae bacterium]